MKKFLPALLFSIFIYWIVASDARSWNSFTWTSNELEAFAFSTTLAWAINIVVFFESKISK